MYESIQGTTIYLTRWDLNAPDIIIQCYSCNKGILEHTRSQVSTQATPIFNLCGRSSWEFGTSYKCNNCSDVVRSSNGTLLYSLPDYLTQSFPVDPRYCSSSSFVLLNDSVSLLLEEATLTDASATWVSRLLFQGQNHCYEVMEGSYYTTDPGCPVASPPFDSFPSIGEWRGQYPPSSSQLLDLYEKAADSNLTMCGVSDNERHIREI